MAGVKGVSGNPKGRPPGITSKRASTTKNTKKCPQKASNLNERSDVLEFLADVYQDRFKGHPNIDLETCIKAAVAFANYRYPKLQVTHTTTGTPGQSHADWVKDMTKAIRESDEPKLKRINGEAVEMIEERLEEQRTTDTTSDDQDDNALRYPVVMTHAPCGVPHKWPRWVISMRSANAGRLGFFRFRSLPAASFSGTPVVVVIPLHSRFSDKKLKNSVSPR
jgi:hypothetical protein